VAITLGWGTEVMGKYLKVDEQATYIDVFCDGFVYRLYTNVHNDWPWKIRNLANSSEWGEARFSIENGGTEYYYRYDASKVVTILENTPNRVVIKATFLPRDSGGSNSPTNLTNVDLWIYFYPSGIIVYDMLFNCSGDVTFDDEIKQYGLGTRFSGMTNTDGFIEDSGSETDTAHNNTNTTGLYCVSKSDEMNIQTIVMYSDNTTTLYNRYESYTAIWNDMTVVDGDRLVLVLVMDSSESSKGDGDFLDWDTDIDTNAVAVGAICGQSADSLRYYCHTAHTAGAGNEPPDTDYWWEYRMTLGVQYNDLVMAAPTTGSEVTDLVIPMDLSSDGFASDGRHLEMSSDEIEYTADINRVGHLDVIEDPPIETGTVGSATDHLIEHIKADDNAASSVVVATVGNNGVWQAADETARNTSNESISTDIDRGTGLDTTDTYLIDHSVTVYDNAYFKQGTKQIWFTPQFGYDDGADQTIWSLYVDAGDYIQITYDAGNDAYELRVSWGATLVILSGPAYTESDTLQQLTFIQASWDSDENLCQLVINGEVVDNDTNTGTPSASGAAYVMTGADCVTDADGTAQLPADIYIGDSKAIDGMLRNEGAYFTGNGAVDTDHAHEDITFLWQGADATPIGTDVTNDGGDYSTDGPIGTKAFDNSDAGDNASAATSGNISAAEGSMSFWFKPNSALGADCTLFYADAAFKVWWDDSDNDVVFTYNTDVLNMTTAFAAGDTLWHHVEIKWKASDSLYINIDGLVTSLLTGVDSAPTLDATMFFTADDADGTNRADVLMSDVMITDTMGTPQIPVILGSGPIHVPIRGVE